MQTKLTQNAVLFFCLQIYVIEDMNLSFNSKQNSSIYQHCKYETIQGTESDLSKYSSINHHGVALKSGFKLWIICSCLKYLD